MTDSARRFRNYGSVLDRHERDQRIRKILRVFTYFAIILIVVMLIVILSRTGERLEKQSQPGTSWVKKESQPRT
jgi:hypothetical protein